MVRPLWILVRGALMATAATLASAGLILALCWADASSHSKALKRRIAELEAERRAQVEEKTPRATGVEGATLVDVCRKTLRSMAENPQAAIDGARFVPTFRDGQPVGFKLYGIQSESSLAMLGFINGDLLGSVNNLALSGPETASRASHQLRGAPFFDVELWRKSKLHRLLIVPHEDC